MKSCTIIISHYESLPFLERCLRQIRKHKNDEIDQRVLVIDQSIHDKIQPMLLDGESHIHITPLYSGYGLDYAFRRLDIKTDYICQLHADAFPISDNWLKIPITLMEENDFKFTGVLQFICDKESPIYPPTKGVFGMAQCFNVGKTEVYKEMALEGGFTRFHNRPISGLTWNNNDWADWAQHDYSHRGSDDDVPAFFWEDKYREHDKMSFGYTGKIGITGEESNYGTIIEDLVFHFGYHREGLGVMPQMGKKYQEWTRRINENYSDELLQEMLAEARSRPMNCLDMRMQWDGKTKKAIATKHSINKRILELQQS